MNIPGESTIEVNNGIGTLTFSHPKANSLPKLLLKKIAAQIDDLTNDRAVKVILLRSAGEVFCSGASFDEFKEVKSVNNGVDFFSGFAEIILAIRRSTKFVVARVQGKAVGGGVGVISAADYAFAAKTASIRLSEFALGFGPFVIGPAVQRKLGLNAFSELAVSAEWRDANWAKERGLYQEVFDDTDKLDLAVIKFCEKLAHSNPDAMAKLKSILWEGTDYFEKLLRERARTTSGLVMSEFVQAEVRKLG